MQNHEYANLFPMMADADLRELAKDIGTNGLRDAIVTLEGKILDGRNRHRACELAGVVPTFEEFIGEDALGFVISHNLHRRHLTESQRGMVAAKLANLKDGQRPDRVATPIDAPKISAVTKQEACEALNVGVSTLDRARKIQRVGSPELNAAVESGEVTVGAAYKVAELPHDEQRKVLSQGLEAVKAKAKEIREAAKPVIEPEPVIVDGTKPSNPRAPKWKPDDAERLWLLAKTDLDKILPSDVSRQRIMEEVITYAKNRIDKNI